MTLQITDTFLLLELMNEAGKDLDKAMCITMDLQLKVGINRQGTILVCILSRNAGDANKSLKHLKIAAAQGHDAALTRLKSQSEK